MMQQILRDMFVEPELLAELNEEQKQILFYKIRQEQVRRWSERESQGQGGERSPGPRRNPGLRRSVKWLLGSDGEVWVWIMGEAPGDKPYQQIAKELMEDRARRQAQLEAQELWRAKEAEIKQKFRDAMAKEKARYAAVKWRAEAEDRRVAKEDQDHIREELKKREEEERQREEGEIRRAEVQRTRELLIRLEQEQSNSDTDDVEWQEHLSRSKAADEEMTRKARSARDEYQRQSRRAVERRRVGELTTAFHHTHLRQAPQRRRHSTSMETMARQSTDNGIQARPRLQPAAPPLFRRRQSRRHSTMATQPLMDSPAWVRAPRPRYRDSIMLWYNEEEWPRQAGVERSGSTIAPWFHGQISRQEAEKRLTASPVGSFLVRVSDRIWGYTLSYRTGGGFKHFLDASGDCCSFLGVDQIRHATLSDLIDFHKEEVITTAGGELLQEACTRADFSTDCGGLFPKDLTLRLFMG
ncbi:SH2 domain-containing protein 4B [Denticeps clupeoides]|uniref:SH2 domain-containing protein 4B n=1 Tax=Denticeps clupeoides TaxID=299321 RepID=UPI0010A50FFA|nr:SH2 domain-containing protein 4B-like [Denticeps clupeoides]